MTFPKIGNLAPVFALENQRGETVSLKQFRGTHNVVLYFYPAAMTPGCTVQACGLRDAAAELAARDAVVLGVSPDPVAKLAKFAGRDRLGFDLLSDPEHAVALKYGAWGPKKFMGRSYDGILRTSFLIGKDGRLRHVIENVKTRTHHDEVIALLDGMR
ncbi:MAG: Peroxiredoxin Bcp [Pseudomonadales bacterium]|nr:Peroxiredoxin Bcp [Pseudomonadales bacterium]